MSTTVDIGAVSLPGRWEGRHGPIYPRELRPESAATARFARRRLARCARFGAVATAIGPIAGRALRAKDRVASLPSPGWRPGV